MSEEATPLFIPASMTDAGLLPFGLQEVEQVRVLLRGGSVVDWRRLAFRDVEHVDEYLRLCGLRAEDPVDAMRMWHMLARSIDYVERTFDHPIAEEVRRPDDVRQLFVLASREGPARLDACMVLKVMHVVFHITGRELLFRLPVAAAELFHRIETKVFDAVDGMKASGVDVVEFSGSRKTSDSVITKLLSRADSVASEVHDRLRFRVVTRSLADVFGALVYVTSSLCPFNYIIPGASRNDLVDFRRTLETDPQLCPLAHMLQLPIDLEEKQRRCENAFSGPGYKMINFVVDMPVRVDDLVAAVASYQEIDGGVIFVLVEFQIVDQETDRANERGENRHTLYKARQHARVLERLTGKARL